MSEVGNAEAHNLALPAPMGGIMSTIAEYDKWFDENIHKPLWSMWKAGEISYQDIVLVNNAYERDIKKMIDVEKSKKKNLERKAKRFAEGK